MVNWKNKKNKISELFEKMLQFWEWRQNPVGILTSDFGSRNQMFEELQNSEEKNVKII